MLIPTGILKVVNADKTFHFRVVLNRAGDPVFVIADRQSGQRFINFVTVLSLFGVVIVNRRHMASCAAMDALTSFV